MDIWKYEPSVSADLERSPTHHKIIWLDAKQIPKVAKRYGRIDLVSELAVMVGRCKARTLWWKGDALDFPEVHHK